MIQIYKTLKQSEDTANKEREYRKSLSNAIQHEADLAELIFEPDTYAFENNDKNEKQDEEVEKVEDNNNIPNDSFFPTHKKKIEKG